MQKLPTKKTQEFLAFSEENRFGHVGANDWPGVLQGAAAMIGSHDDEAAEVYEWSPDGDEDAYVHVATLRIEMHI